MQKQEETIPAPCADDMEANAVDAKIVMLDRRNHRLSPSSCHCSCGWQVCIAARLMQTLILSSAAPIDG
jgi:hypothetical protein